METIPGPRPTLSEHGSVAETRRSPYELSSTFIVRLAALPARCLTDLATGVSARLVAQIDALEGAAQANSASLSEMLYRVIGTIDNGKQRRRAVDIRRHLFNGRSLSADDWSVLSSIASRDTVEAVRHHQNLLELRRDTGNALRRATDVELFEARTALKRWIVNADFRNAVSLASSSLANNVDRYVRSDSAQPTAREQYVERGLLRYLTRAAAKCSPFSTFCTVIEGHVLETAPSASANGFIKFEGSLQHKRTVARLNKAYLRVLLDQLQSTPSVRRNLPLAINSTLVQSNRTLKFLTAAHAIERFQTIPHSDVVELVLDLLRGHEGCTLTSLGRLLVQSDAIDASDTEAIEYLEGLVEVGLLRLGFGLREQDADWDRHLHEILGNQIFADDPTARDVRRLLEDLRTALDGFPRAEGDEREAIVSEMRAELQSGHSRAGGSIPWSGRSPLFEDATADVLALLERSGSIAEPLGVAAEFLELAACLAFPREEQFHLRAFFDRRYSADTRVPLMTFFEDYYRSHQRSFAEQRAAAAAAAGGQIDAGTAAHLRNPFGLDSIERLRNLRSSFTELVRDEWRNHPGAEEITIPLQRLRPILDAAREFSVDPLSISVFAQVAHHPRSGRPILIAPGGTCLGGFGKYFSRFLNLFSDGFLASVQHEIRNVSNVVIAEICSDGFFNANLHPRLTDYEIRYPLSDDVSRPAQIEIANLTVEPDAASPNQLVLRDEIGRRILPVDLGFLNPSIRPALFDLLTWLTPVVHSRLVLPETVTVPSNPADAATASNGNGAQTGNDAGSEGSGVTTRPRITLDGQFVIARHRWTIPAGSLPRRLPGDADGDFFLHVQRWRKDHGIPARVFMRVHVTRPRKPEESLNNDGREAAESPRPAPKQTAPGPRDFRKPQFIDFNSPLLVNLFEHAHPGGENFVVFLEEALPDPDDGYRIGADTYAGEFVFQLHSNAKKAGPH